MHSIVVSSADTNQDLPPKGVIFIGNRYDAINLNFLKKYNIIAVVNAAVELQVFNCTPQYMKVPLEDIPSQNIIEYLPQVTMFIDETIEKGNVLVHCSMGISRSVSLVIGYFMIKYAYDYKSIYDYVKSQRAIADPNIGFKKQLQKLRLR